MRNEKNAGLRGYDCKGEKGNQISEPDCHNCLQQQNHFYYVHKEIRPAYLVLYCVSEYVFIDSSLDAYRLVPVMLSKIFLHLLTITYIRRALQGTTCCHMHATGQGEELILAFNLTSIYVKKYYYYMLIVILSLN
ncbi:hypothetical protein ACJX0J_031699 [Zea mays]